MPDQGFPAEHIRDEVAQLLSHPLHFPDEFKRWMGDYITVNVPMIPFSHIFGAKINIGRSGDYIETSETPSVTSGGLYWDLATVGPQILQLSDGEYLFAYGCNTRGQMSISFNGSTPEDDDSVQASGIATPTARLIQKSLKTDNNNTVVLKYKAGIRSFSARWLIAIRLGSPGTT